jgi:hypothetical protein
MLNVREYQRGNEKRNIDEEKPKKTKNKKTQHNKRLT